MTKGLVLGVVTIFVLYIVIETAVRRGINASKLGKYIDEQTKQREETRKDLDD
ncbi:hypothetical protein MUN88_07490 [Gracilibacillus caseinilyticus]|uniref:Uncharacterized protein n=1 Tax=Gracilibacillus caseinilyticus TaxID=2932256 RepID=A0ABY4F066_9BACI|nr:hypothetical protein [Gracilibacillus caseinilyticus]UOQ49903.1 hypothetical protein MUN88_07490 [Gracilibacillus caseinilyticus]